MQPVHVALMVLGTLVSIAVILKLVWLPIGARLKRMPDELRGEITAAGERIVAEPEQASYRGATAEYGRVKGLGVAVLTDRRLVFRGVFGKTMEILREQIVDVRTDQWFLRAYNGQTVVIMKTRSGAEVGFAFLDAERWATLLRPRPAFDRPGK